MNIAGEKAGKPKRSSAFSIPIATAAKETRGRNGIMTRVRSTVSSALPGIVVEAGSEGGDERPGEDDRPGRRGPQQHGQEGQEAAGQREGGLAAALLRGVRA